ncbi:TlpA family protein disulfide reductase [Formosa sp. PL04]|uniref:TlpA family protein disulfide reductase n=1 Tax=Formosa sp. PL04 TaxID=3081755 RepID=UPI002982B324|nr:TlpA family protein disulfide reductase [Formosa sp. PL04]MDW5290374.1 TlpA family protein disulfide reductase [Formosa sp. PL04]
MKIKTTILFLTAIFMIACNSGKKIAIEDAKFDKYFFKEKNIPVVTGKVLNLTDEEIENIKLEYSLVTPFAQNENKVKKNGKLNPDGTFELEIDCAFPYQQIWLHAGKLFYAGIYANSDLYIELDADSLRKKRAYMNGAGVKYLGTDGEVNSLLNDHILYTKKQLPNIGKAISKVKRDRDLDYKTFLSKYDSLYVILHKIDDEFIEMNPSPYSWLIKNERLSDYYGDICVKHWSPKAPQMSENLFENIKNHKPLLVSNNGSGFYSYLFTYLETRAGKYNRINIDNFLGYTKLSSSEKQKINEYSNIKAQRDNEIPYDTIRLRELSKSIYPMLKDTIIAFKTAKKINYIDSLFTPNKADLLKLKISSKDPKEKKIVFETTLNTVSTEWCKEVLESNYEESIEEIASIERILKDEKSFTPNKNIGTPIAELPFGAKLYKVDNLKAEELLSNIKTAFNDKALILDFWATWCAPCLGDMPYSKKLHDEFKSEPIEFVYLCTSNGSDIEKWKTKIIELEMGGTHLFIESSIENELMELFSFSGFPSYAFIDKSGNYKAGAIKRMSYLKKEKLKELIGAE